MDRFNDNQPNMGEREQRSLTLPKDLQQAVAHVLAAAPKARWMRQAQELSERYRAPRDTRQPLASGSAEALGYAALILPATYAQLHGAMAATAARIPGWAPETMLDLGSGPGTALWAAAARWPTLLSMTAWEREPAFITLGRDLARESASPAVRAARWERVDLVATDHRPPTTDHRPPTTDHRPPRGGRGEGERGRGGEGERGRGRPQAVDNVLTYDLVVLGHVLNELDAADRARVVADAWRMTAGLLLIIEPGTPVAFAVVRAARDELLGAGARTIAPCVHDRPCPLENDWCHFPQRLIRPDFQRRARAAPSQWEDSKYAYAAMARFAADHPIWARVIREPASNKAYAEVKLSTRKGIARYRGLKRHRETFRLVKGLEWGAALGGPLPEPIEELPEKEEGVP
jgi:ribosomal protein RSM22 (predicted rRNA methylase)